MFRYTGTVITVIKNNMSVGHHNPPPRPRDGISSALGAYFSELSHSAFTVLNGLHIYYSLPYILQIFTSMVVASRLLLNLIKVTFLKTYPSLKQHILFHSNGLAIWHSFSSITHNKVNKNRKSVHQQTKNDELMLGWCWHNIYDARSTVNPHWSIILYLLEYRRVYSLKYILHCSLWLNYIM